MDSSSEAASAASGGWSWTVCAFLSGIFFGTIIGMLLYWKSSLQAKLWALLGHCDTPSAPPMVVLPEDTSPESLQSGPSSRRRVIEHDVFISFRGSDTRSNFTNHLYRCLVSKGISILRDDEELHQGDGKFRDLIRRAIETSRISVIVFSKNYAASSWCLDELAAISNCHQELGQNVIPIFYDVDPSDVRHQKGVYRDAFVLHEERFRENSDKVNRWRSAMMDLATLSGWDIRNKPAYAEIEKIVQDVMEKLHKFPRTVEDIVEIQLPTDSKGLESRPSSQQVYKYDVFLSFRGTETCNKFIYHLWNYLVRQGISTFRDDEMLEKGELISSQLLQAIKDSRISIIVFSRDYATSIWCLEEMATIVDCYQELRQIVIPVFYDVCPSNVRKQTGPYEHAFVSLTKIFRKDPGRVNRWKEAMTCLANLSGFNKTDEPDSVLIEMIGREVMGKLGHKLLLSMDDLVGIQPRVEELEKLLKLGSEDDDFRVVGIWGMGGIGKTTLAKVLYDKIFDQFDACCFIENVRGIYRDGGAIAVQKEILHQTLNEKNQDIDSPYGISGLVRRRLSQKRVLMVLDDVDNVDTLEKFATIPKLLGGGSRTIVTTRDIHILKAYGAAAIFNVPQLNYNEALELFIRKAFDGGISSSTIYVDLIPKVLELTNGLPLAIKVLGSFLYNTDATQWKYALDGLRKGPQGQIMDTLKISFDSLDQNEKEIFLHIACFFHGQREEYVLRILDSCGLYPRIGIQVLVEKSLITIKNRKIHMHDLIQELGRDIVRQECPKEPGKRSRLWRFADFEHVLMAQTGTDNVEAIVVNEKEDVSKCDQLRIEGLSKMKNLKLLILCHKNFSGSPNYLSNKLRYLLWSSYPFSSLPLFERYSLLVELNLPSSNIKQLRQGPKDFLYLKRMNLSNSKHLKKTLIFERSPNLEWLDFTGCTSLVYVHPSIGSLEQLTYLSLRNCSNLVHLHLGTNCKLSSLRVLHLSGCTKLRDTPKFMGLPNLKYFDLEKCTSLLTVHESIVALTKLKFLSLRDCTNLVEIPDNINHMKSLQTLDLSNCIKLMNLPRGQRVRSSSYLEYLVFPGFRKLRGIPDAFGELRCLERLNLERSYFGFVPDSITEFSRLAYLNLVHCPELTRFPELKFDSLHQGKDISEQYPHLVIID